MNLTYRIALFANAMLLVALGGAAQAQAPIRIGASLSQTGSYANLGQNRLRAYQLCVKDTNKRVGYWAGKSSWLSKTISRTRKSRQRSTRG